MQALRQFSQIKTFSELMDFLSWEILEYLAAIPIILFSVTPFVQMMYSFFTVWEYEMTIDSCNYINTILGIVVILLFIGKVLFNKITFRQLWEEHQAMFFFIPFVLLMIVSTIINGATDYAIKGTAFPHESLFTFIRYFMVYYFCGSLIQKPKIKAIFSWIFIGTSVFLGILALMDYADILYIAHFRDARYLEMSCIFINPNYYGYYLTLVILLSSGIAVMEQNRALRWLATTAFVANVIVLIINQTFGCYLACLAGLIFQLIVTHIIDGQINFRALGAFVMYIFITVIMSFFYENVVTDFIRLFLDIQMIIGNDENAGHAGTSRFKLWVDTIEFIKQKPIFGWGVEGTRDIRQSPPHNEYLQHACFFGIPAALCYICGVFSVYLHALKHKKELDLYTFASLIAAFGYLVSAFFGNTKFYIVPLFCILLGFGYQPSVKKDVVKSET